MTIGRPTIEIPMSDSLKFSNYAVAKPPSRADWFTVRGHFQMTLQMQRPSSFAGFWSITGPDRLDADRVCVSMSAERTHTVGLCGFGRFNSAIAGGKHELNQITQKNPPNGGAFMTWTGFRNGRSYSDQNRAIPRFFRSVVEDFV
jgi:hypothetical protein